MVIIDEGGNEKSTWMYERWTFKIACSCLFPRRGSFFGAAISSFEVLAWYLWSSYNHGILKNLRNRNIHKPVLSQVNNEPQMYGHDLST